MVATRLDDQYVKVTCAFAVVVCGLCARTKGLGDVGEQQGRDADSLAWRDRMRRSGGTEPLCESADDASVGPLELNPSTKLLEIDGTLFSFRFTHEPT
jgi:hypothetical protein